MYEIIFISQTLAQLCLSFVYCASTTFGLCTSILVCAQYDILFCSIKNLHNTAMIKNGQYIPVMKLII